jgi:hypothetical protein
MTKKELKTGGRSHGMPGMDVTFYPYGKRVSLNQVRIRLAILEWTVTLMLILAGIALGIALGGR